MKLDKALPIPLYHQLKTLIEEKIASDEWTAGYQLPTEKELAELLQVSRITVKRAISDLVNAGLLYRQQGKGTFVCTPGQERDIIRLLSLSGGGNHPHRTISYLVEAAGTSLAKTLRIDDSDLVIKLLRLKIEEKQPIGVEYSYLPYSLSPDLSVGVLEDALIYDVLKNQLRIELGHAKISISSSIANEYEASLMGVEKNSSIYVLERITFTVQNQVAEYSKFIIRHDKARFFLEVSLH